jgi:hypothetical protein
MLHFKPSRFLHNQETTWLVLDVLMLGLLMLNLSWLIFDWLVTLPWFSALLQRLAPVIASYYVDNLAPVFWKIDGAFVTLFLGEFVLRWTVATRRRTYPRWYFYPLFHWYELLGCIPLAGFRALRFLRVFSMAYRLQKLGVIDFTDTAPARLLGRYYAVLVEEVSDRVVENVLEGIQHELRADHQPVVRRIINEVVLDRKPEVIEALGRRLELVVRDHYDMNRDAVQLFVDARIRDAVAESEDVLRLQLVPVFGDYGVRMLERTIAQIVFGVIDGTALDLQTEANRGLINELISTTVDELLQEDQHIDRVVNDMLIEAMDILKAQVRVQRWREDFK